MKLLPSAIAVARAAGELQRQRAATGFVIEAKGAADLVTEVDEACERLIAAHVAAHHPGHGFLGEEGTASPTDANGFVWIADPLDGTKNYAHRYARSCVSIAIAEQGEVVVGVVFNPHTGELFAAERGLGATLNDAPIRVSTTAKLSRAMVASALTYDPAPGVRRADRLQLERLERVLAAAEAVRADGCCALDLCDVARGRFDAYFEPGLKAWDTAAGALIVREAGGEVTTFEGRLHQPGAPTLVASNGFVHAALREQLASPHR